MATVRPFTAAWGSIIAGMSSLLVQLPAWAEGGVTIVKQPGRATDALSPTTQAVIQFCMGAIVIALLVFMVNMILMRGLKVNPLTSSRFAVLAGLLMAYCLFAVLFTSVFVGSAKVLMYLCLAVMAVGSVFVLVTQKSA
jgi:hypothetical protein